MRADYSCCMATRNSRAADNQRNVDISFVWAFFTWREAVLRDMVALMELLDWRN